MTTALGSIGNAALHQRNLALACSVFQQSMDIAQRIGDRHSIARSLLDLGLLAKRQGDLGLALKRMTEAVTIHRDLGEEHGTAIGLVNLVPIRVNHLGGDGFQLSRQDLLECLHLVEKGDRKKIGTHALAGAACLILYYAEHLISPDMALKNRRAAVRLYSAAASLQSAIGSTAPFEGSGIATLRKDLGNQLFQEEWDKGQEWTFMEALAEAQQWVRASDERIGVPGSSSPCRRAPLHEKSGA
jgi:hypothetical protein